jgi:hypothetical protein
MAKSDTFTSEEVVRFAFYAMMISVIALVSGISRSSSRAAAAEQQPANRRAARSRSSPQQQPAEQPQTIYNKFI